MFGFAWKKILRLLPVGLLLMAASFVLAQDNTRTLIPNTPTSGVLDTDNVAQLYRFDGTEGQVVTLSVSSANGLGLALLLSDADGEPVAQDFVTAGETALDAVILPQTGTYYVTVLSAIGVTLPPNSQFTLTLETDDAASVAEATITPVGVGVAVVPTVAAPEETSTVEPEATAEPEATVEVTPTESIAPTSVPQAVFAPGEILTASGLNVNLTWDTTANLDLEIRDPVGGSLRFATPQVNSGGVFDVNVNSVCNTATFDNPTESAAWPAGAIPTGSYELLIYYQPLEDCPTTEPVDFSITVTLDDEVIDSISGTLLPQETYLSSVVIEADGTIVEGASGLYTDTAVLPLPAAEFIANAVPITRDVPVEGIITSPSYYQAYSFEGLANEIITINLNATSGSLDTLLLLLDANGVIIDTSDDIGDGITNSQILNRRLISDSTYTIIATRYGKDVGGTEGGYQLSVTGPSGDLPQELLDLGLPRGAIEVSLLWNTNADIQLLVRDPRGDSVFADTPTAPSGGSLAASGNVNCTASQTSPLSYVYWPEGNLVPGLYEVEVIYRNQCTDTRPVNFTLTARVDGQTIYSDTANPTPNEWYVTSFTIDVNRQVTAASGGFIGTRDRLNSLAIDYVPELPNALTITAGQTINGSITPDNKFDLYTFTGQANDVVTINLTRTAGNLDTTLFLLDSNGLQLAFNDDVVPGDNTDSLISEFTLPQDGQYIIIATHFGLQYGGTTGTYNLSFSRLNEN